MTGRRSVRPPGPPAPSVRPDLGAIHAANGPARLTWIGHASFLGTLDGAHFLVDPVFSGRIGWVVERHGNPGLTPRQLPPVDALLISHAHYDHLDAPSVRALASDTPAFVPLGVGRWLRRYGLRRITELDWWETARAGALEITLVPARHWSRRSLGDTNRTLWGGFVIGASGVRVYHAGDSAWFEGFREIGERFPKLLAAMLPIGAYDPPWFMEYHHLNPEQAGSAFRDLGARHLVGMHWGTFKLTDEPLAEPAERLRRWWAEHVGNDESRLHLPAVGQTLRLEDGRVGA